MSWLFSRVLVEAYSEGICSDGEPSAPLSGNPTPQAYLCSDKMMGFSRLSRFGMTFRLLTESRGEALLMSYLEGFHAKTYQLQERVQGLTESDQGCGEKWQGSFAKYDPDTHSLRTHQCSLLEDLTESCQTLPAWGLMQDGVCWEQPTLERRIRGTESGLSEKWATPTTMDKLPPKSQQALLKEATQARPGRSKPANLRDQVSNMQNWPTPTVNGNYNRKGLSPTSGDGLATAVRKWRTPQSADSKSTIVQKGHQTNLTHQVMKWPTPTAHNAKETNAPSEALRNEPTLASRVGGTLNPTWVEWLMGWPLEWTDLKPLAMDKFQQWQQQHGSC